MIVTVDTQILIWGVRQVADEGDEDRIPACVALLKWLDERGTTIVLTAPCVAEYLVGGTDDDRAEEMASLTNRFRIIDFNAKAAKLAGSLRSDPDFIRSLGDGVKKTRNAVKADIQIVATAKAGLVDWIYSDDNDVKNIAHRAKLPRRPIPKPEELSPELARGLFREK